MQKFNVIKSMHFGHVVHELLNQTSSAIQLFNFTPHFTSWV